MAEDSVGQVLRIDVGLWLAIAVVRCQLIQADPTVEADGFYATCGQTFKQCERAVGVEGGGVVGIVAEAALHRYFIGAIPLGVDDSLVVPPAVRPEGYLAGRVDIKVVIRIDVDPGGGTYGVVVHGDDIIEPDVAVQVWVGLLGRLVKRRLTIGDEVRCIDSASVASRLGTLEEVGRGLEHVFVVGPAGRHHGIQDFLQRVQCTWVFQVDCHRAIDLVAEIRQEDIHSARSAGADTVFQRVERGGQRGFCRCYRVRTHTARCIDHERDVVVLALHHVQAGDVGHDNVVAIAAIDGVAARGAGDRIVGRWVHRDGQLRGGGR